MNSVPDTSHTTTFTKTISEFDVYSFAGITGDFSPNHVNAEAMANTVYGERIAHGVLVLGLGSTVASQYLRETGLSAVSYGYDKVRFIRAVRIGDTVTVSYRISQVDPERSRSVATVTGKNQHDQVVLAAQHILQLIDATQVEHSK